MYVSYQPSVSRLKRSSAFLRRDASSHSTWLGLGVGLEFGLRVGLGLGARLDAPLHHLRPLGPPEPLRECDL